MIIDLTDTLLPPHASIREAITCIDKNKSHVVFVIESGNRLIGSVTDGDVRRGLLRGVDLEKSVRDIMNPHPLSARVNDSPITVRELMSSKGLRHIPIVDQEHCIIGVETLEALIQTEVRPNWVFLMAGGLGTRLRPLTQECPKPLLPVGNKAILETILESFIAYGFRRFFISVFFKAEMIKAHFGDGRKWGVQIDYVEEVEPLGTAGALGLLPDIPAQPLILMNGDILTKANFSHLLEFHDENNAMATMCVRKYDFQVPYGTVELNGHLLTRMVEKPTYSFYVNAGIYVFSPEAIKLIKRGQHEDVPHLLEQIQSSNEQVAAYPLHEYWLDIGRMDDFLRAQDDQGAAI